MRTGVAFAIGVVAACASCRAPTAADDGRVAAGLWGGDHVRVEVTRAGATLEYDCAHGTIDEPLVADATGRFSLKGSHTFEHGGPIRVDEQLERHPARYDGRADGGTLRFTVTVTDLGREVGAFMVSLGAQPRLVKCL